MQRRWATMYIAFFLVTALAAVVLRTYRPGEASGGLTYVVIFSATAAFLIAALAFLPRRG